MGDAGLLDAAFRLSVVLAAAGGVVCVGIAVRARRAAPSARTHELTWTLVPLALLGALLGMLGHG